VSTVVESTTHESHDVESVEVASVLLEHEARVATATRVKNTFFILLLFLFLFVVNIRTFFHNSKLKSKILVVLHGLEPWTY